MATLDLELPNDEELTVPEVNISSPALRAGAFHLGKKCESQNNVSSNSTAANINFWLHHQSSNPLFFFRYAISKQNMNLIFCDFIVGIHVVYKGAERSTPMLS